MASDAASKANQATAKVRLSLLSDPAAPSTPPRTPPSTSPAQEPKAASTPPNSTPAPPPAAAGGNAGLRVALVIGNGAYAAVRALPNPPNDARSVAKSLRDIGFTVSEGIDLDRATMQKMTRDFLREAARAQVALVYYAGHGVQIDGRNYLIPVDVRLQAGGNITDGMVDMDTILAALDDQVRTNILIFDACRNNPLEPQVASTGPNRAIEAGSGLAAPTALGVRRDARRRNADRVRDRARTGRARRRRRQQPVLGGAVAPHRHARPRGAADADAGARRSRRRDQEQAGAVVEFLAARRGLSGGEVRTPSLRGAQATKQSRLSACTIWIASLRSQ